MHSTFLSQLTAAHVQVRLCRNMRGVRCSELDTRSTARFLWRRSYPVMPPGRIAAMSGEVHSGHMGDSSLWSIASLDSLRMSTRGRRAVGRSLAGDGESENQSGARR